MNKKTENLKEIDYYNNFNIVGQLLIELKKTNSQYNEAVDAWKDVGFYVNSLILNQRYIDKTISEYKLEKIRAVERAKRNE